MLKHCALITSCVVALIAGSANATTFDYTVSIPLLNNFSGGGTFTATPDGGGVYTITAITGGLTTNCPNSNCKQIGALLPPNSYGSDNLLFFPTAPYLDDLGVSFSLIQILPDDSSAANIRYSNGEYLISAFGCTQNDCISNVPIVFDVTVASTPVPSTLPLFATGLGALGLLGWRRKRKAAAAVAT